MLNAYRLQTTGNCNTSSSTLLYKTGVPMKTIKNISNKIKGNDYGFGDIKPWTRDEKIKAIEK